MPLKQNSPDGHGLVLLQSASGPPPPPPGPPLVPPLEPPPPPLLLLLHAPRRPRVTKALPKITLRMFILASRLLPEEETHAFAFVAAGPSFFRRGSSSTAPARSRGGSAPCEEHSRIRLRQSRA